MTRVELVLAALGMEIASRRGDRGWMLCPYHDDHSPTSFFVRLRGDNAGRYHCFSCKAGGGLLGLVMHVRECDAKEAKAFVRLAGKGFSPTRRRVRLVSPPPVLGRRMFRMPKEVIFEPLAQWVGPAKEYALERGLTQDELDVYGIGYAVDGHRVGGRIVIPWLGRGNVPAGYSARTFCDQEPKYLTPAPGENPDRSVMFGEHLWPPEAERRFVVVTEGAFNAMAVRRVLGDVPVAALGGSELDPLQVVKLSYFPRVVIVTDPDAAGRKAAESLARAVGRYAETKRVRLPKKHDALDVLLKLGPEELRQRLAPAVATAP